MNTRHPEKSAASAPAPDDAARYIQHPNEFYPTGAKRPKLAEFLSPDLGDIVPVMAKNDVMVDGVAWKHGQVGKITDNQWAVLVNNFVRLEERLDWIENVNEPTWKPLYDSRTIPA